MSVENNRVAWIDHVRGTLMFLVFYYHSEVYYSTNHAMSWYFGPFFLGGFFFLSGYMFKQNTVIFTKLKSVFRSIIFPYVIFTTAMLLPKIIIDSLNAQQGIIDIITFRASWFVITIGMLQIIYTLLTKSLIRTRYVIIATVLLVLLGTCINMYYPDHIPQSIKDNLWIYSPTYPDRLPLCIVQVLLSSPFFMAGILYRKYEFIFKKFENWTSVFICGTIYIAVMILDKRAIGSYIYMATNSYHNYCLILLYGILGTFVIILLAKIGVMGRIPFIKYAGQYSLLFYFLNAVSIRFVSYTYRWLGIEKILGYNTIGIFTVAITAFCITYPLTYIIVRFTPIIIGDKKTFNKWSQRLHINTKW